MNFEEFQNRAPLYVLGALDTGEMAEVEEAKREFGQKAKDCIRKCYASRDAFALTLRPAEVSVALKERLMSMVRERQQRGWYLRAESPC